MVDSEFDQSNWFLIDRFSFSSLFSYLIAKQTRAAYDLATDGPDGDILTVPMPYMVRCTAEVIL